MQESNHDTNHDNQNSMSVENDTVFSLLLDLNKSVSGIGATVDSLSKRVDDLADNLTTINQIANEADERSKNLEKQVSAKTQYLMYVLIPLASAIIPTLIGHIRIR